MNKPPPTPWLLFIHQIPKEPAYLRVKVGRRLAAVGALAIKNSVYVLPNTEGCREDFSWIRREIVDGSGDASLFEASAIEGLTQADLARQFREARAADYHQLAAQLDAVDASTQKSNTGNRGALLTELSRVEERIAEVERIDFFSRDQAVALRKRVAMLRTKLDQPSGNGKSQQTTPLRIADYQGRTWVTRQGVKVDRVACAWLIANFIDKKAKFRFVEAAAYTQKKGELRFDMPDGEFTHEGDLCSFEVLCKHFQLTQPGLVRIAEMVHDLDVKDARYARPETPGLGVLIQGIVAQHARDEARIAAASLLFDALVASAQSGAEPARKKR